MISYYALLAPEQITLLKQRKALSPTQWHAALICSAEANSVILTLEEIALQPKSAVVQVFDPKNEYGFTPEGKHYRNEKAIPYSRVSIISVID